MEAGEGTVQGLPTQGGRESERSLRGTLPERMPGALGRPGSEVSRELSLCAAHQEGVAEPQGGASRAAGGGG